MTTLDPQKKHVGFTGTKRGMTLAQKGQLVKMLADLTKGTQEVVFHHGDCIGADTEAEAFAWELGYTIAVHPPLDSSRRAVSRVRGRTLHTPKEFLERNHDIVDQSSLLIACPASYKEVLRSGTWATVRYARRKQREVIVIYPSGDLGK